MYTYICIYVYMYICIYVYMYMYMCMYMYMYIIYIDMHIKNFMTYVKESTVARKWLQHLMLDFWRNQIRSYGGHASIGLKAWNRNITRLKKTWPVLLSDLGMNKSPLPCICQFVFPIFCTGSHLTKVGTSSWRSVLNVIYGYIIFFLLVVWNIWIIFRIILWISSSQLTNSIIFQRGRAQPPTSH